jgi:hydroxypyruvate isomerase
MKRRNFLQSTALSALGATSLIPTKSWASSPETNQREPLKNRIRHSVCRWCFGDLPWEELLASLVEMGVGAIDLVGPEHWPLLKKYNIHCSMCQGAEISLTKGWNNPIYHNQLIENYTKMIPLVAEAGYTNLICFSGNREGMSDTEGLAHCVAGLKKILPLAEKHGVVLQMELFNQQDHPDYMCDHSAWGIDLCVALGSEHFKLLFDIYHMQIQEGDIIRRIRENHRYFGHYHTAGVPGRHEIDETQELNYPAIMNEILKTGYRGYVAQEYIPRREPKMEVLYESIKRCDV